MKVATLTWYKYNLFHNKDTIHFIEMSIIMHNDFNACFMNILICMGQFSRSLRDIVSSELMLKHKYKSLHYDSFVVTAEFFRYHLILYIYDYSNHKTVDIIYIMHIQFVMFEYH